MNGEKIMSSDEIGRLLGGIYIAVTSTLSAEEARVADGVLFDLAASPRIHGEDRRIYRLIAESASIDTDSKKH